MYRMLRKILRIQVKVSQEEALRLAREHCERQGWPWGEPVHCVLRVRYYHFITAHGFRGANIYGRVNVVSGKVKAGEPTGNWREAMRAHAEHENDEPSAFE